MIQPTSCHYLITSITGDKDLQYHLRRQLLDLEGWITRWRASIRTVSPQTDNDQWGPELPEDRAAEGHFVARSFNENSDMDTRVTSESGEEESESDSGESTLAVDDRVLRAMEEMNVADTLDNDSASEGDYSPDDQGDDSPRGSPKKRRRR